MKKFILPLLIIFLVVVGVGGWSLVNKPTPITIPQPEKPILPTVMATATTAPTPTIENPPLTYVNPSVTIDAFETAIPAKKYADLAPYMAPTVTVIKYATSCCGPLSKTAAINEMAYLSGAIGPWDFSDSNPIAAKLATADPDNFKSAFVGTATNNYTVALTLNDDYLIAKVFITNDYHLITGQ